MTAEITSSDRERPESKGSIWSRAYHWITSALPVRARTVLNERYRVVQALRLRLLLPEGIQFWFRLKRLQKDKARVYELYGQRHEQYRGLNADIEQIERLNDEEAYRPVGPSQLGRSRPDQFGQHLALVAAGRHPAGGFGLRRAAGDEAGFLQDAFEGREVGQDEVVGDTEETEGTTRGRSGESHMDDGLYRDDRRLDWTGVRP